MNYYLDKEMAKKNVPWLYAASDEPIDDYKERYGDNCVELMYMPDCVHYDIEKDMVCNMPIELRVFRGIIQLLDGEYIKDGKVVYDPKPSDTSKWNKDTCTWED